MASWQCQPRLHSIERAARHPHKSSSVQAKRFRAQHLSRPPTLTGQVALITGGSGGMGRAIANEFKKAGARVVATDLGAKEDIGPGIEYRRYDVTSRADTDKVIDAVLADHGKV